MPGSLTTPGRPGARDDAPRRIAFHDLHGVGTQNRNLSRLNGWPMRSPVNASPKPSRATAHELGADVDRYSFIVRDLHSLLLAGLPALRRCLPLCPQLGHRSMRSALRICAITGPKRHCRNSGPIRQSRRLRSGIGTNREAA